MKAKYEVDMSRVALLALRLTGLEQEVLRLRAENEQLRAENEQLRNPNLRPCNSGSGEPWATCSSGSPYCG